MKSRTSFFNAAIFKETVLRFWPLWAAYLALWLMQMTLPLMTELHHTVGHAEAEAVIEDIWSHCLSNAASPAVFICAVAAILAAMASWSFAYNSRSASGYAQLPVTREAMFSSLTLAGLLPVLAINLLVALLTLLGEAVYGCPHLTSAAQWFAVTSLIYLFFYGFSTLCAQLTGNLLVLPAVYVVLNFTAYVVMTLLRYVISTLMYGIDEVGFDLLTWLSPIVVMVDGFGFSYTWETEPVKGDLVPGLPLSFDGWGAALVYAGVGLVFIAVSLLLYRRRRMETAGDVVAVGFLKPVFKYCMTGGCALVLGCLLNAMFSVVHYGAGVLLVAIELLVLMLIGAAIGYYASEMLMKKSFRVFKGSLRGIAVSFLVIAALVLGCELDLLGVERRVPDADEVKSVSIGGSGGAWLEDPLNIEDVIVLHESVIENKAAHEELMLQGGSRYSLSLDYVLQDGTTLSRYYRLGGGYGGTETHEDVYALQEILNCREAVDDRMKTDLPATRDTVVAGHIEVYDPVEGVFNTYDFKAEEAYRLYSECIVPDIADGGLGRVWIVEDDAYWNTVCDARIYIELYDFEGVYINEDYTKHNETFDVAVTTDAVRTMNWLRAHGIEPVPLGEESRYSKYDEPYVVEGVHSAQTVPVPAP